MEKELNYKQTLEFVFAGKAIFTVQSNRTKKRFTYKMKQAKNGSKPYFISVLNGTDNYTNYQYLGTVFNKTEFNYGKKSKISKDSESVRGFDWFFRNLLKGTLGNLVSVYHEGKCGRCGRKLTTPKSIERGIGPECIKHM